MSKAKYNALVKDLNEGLADELACNPDVAHDVAYDVLQEEEWLGPFLSKNGISDHEGRLASDICSGKKF